MGQLARTGAFRQFRVTRGGVQSGIGLVAVALWMTLLLLIGLVVVAVIAHPSRATSVVLVVLDTVRADHCSAYGYAKPTTPRLERLAAEGLLFDHARAVAPWTLPSHASLFTGLLPSQHGCTWEHRWLIDRHETMAERLAKSGFETFGVTTNPNASSLYNLHQGFTTFRETWKQRELHRGLTDSGIANAEVAAWLRQRDRDRPFFLFVNYVDAHLPYTPPPPYDAQFGVVRDHARQLAARANLLQETLLGEQVVGADDVAGLKALYDGELRSVDARLGELLDLLDQLDLAEETLVIVTSDHGEQLGEEGRVDHQLSLAETLLRVPLVVRYPGHVRPARIAETVALTDVKGWLDEIADGRLPDWSPPPDRVPPAFIAQYQRPVDLVELLETHGKNAASIDRRLAAAFRPRQGGGDKLLRAEPGGESFWSVDEAGRETLISGSHEPLPRGVVDALVEALAVARRIDPFSESDEDLASEPPLDPAALENLRQLGYVAGHIAGRAGGADGAGTIGLHASEHWSAGRRAAARGLDREAIAELEKAARLAEGESTILLDLAQAAERSHASLLRDALERYLRAVGSGSPSPATAVAWAKQRLDELRGGDGN